jgi:23S rRNA (pseudouridine1915-N3)-methyltransferase
MRIRVLAVGTRMPAWVNEGVAEYEKRLPREFQLEWVEVPPAKRQGERTELLLAKEAESLQRHLKPAEQLVILDVAGQVISTEQMAATFAEFQMTGTGIAIVIGGPDGVAPELLAQASQRWSLGRITLPHPLVRVVLAEQLYRAWSINARHPYHRG